MRYFKMYMKNKATYSSEQLHIHHNVGDKTDFTGPGQVQVSGQYVLLESYYFSYKLIQHYLQSFKKFKALCTNINNPLQMS